MARYTNIFSKAPVQVQNVNGFDKSFDNSFSAKVGSLIPIVSHQVMPGTTINYDFTAEVQLPPFAADAYGKIDYKVEAFFVPCRVLYGGFQKFVTHDDTTTPPYAPGSGESSKVSTILPFFKIPKENCGLGSLADFLGLKNKGGNFPNLENYYYIPNPLKFLAYHKIYQDWYMDSRVQIPPFSEPNYPYTSIPDRARYLPYTSFGSDSQTEFNPSLADNTFIYSLRQRNWPKDRYTNASLKPQSGNDVALTFSAAGEDDGNGTVNSVGSFTIRGLRAANSIQLWRERNNMAGNRYVDQMKARFGVYPSDAITDRAIYIGSKTFSVYNKSVYQTVVNQSVNESNPFNSVGSKYSSPLGVYARQRDEEPLVSNFKTTEFGYFFVIGSLVPQPSYSSGTDRHLWDNKLADFADPLLAQVGDEPIYKQELFDNTGGINPQFGQSFDTFGYTQRYSHWKYIDDQIHGELSDGGSLQAFAIQRSFDSLPDLSSSFLTIPTNFLDQVTVVKGDLSKYGYWCDFHSKFYTSQPLPAYSIPTLGQPMDTHTETIPLGGTRL